MERTERTHPSDDLDHEFDEAPTTDPGRYPFDAQEERTPIRASVAAMGPAFWAGVDHAIAKLREHLMVSGAGQQMTELTVAAVQSLARQGGGQDSGESNR